MIVFSTAPDYGNLVDTPIDDALAENITDLFRWGMKEELYYKLIKDLETRRPANCEGLVTPETNQEIWELINHTARTKDEKLQYIETTVVKAATLIAKLVNSLTLARNEPLMGADGYGECSTGGGNTIDIDFAKIREILRSCTTNEADTVQKGDTSNAVNKVNMSTAVETDSSNVGNVKDKTTTVETDSVNVNDKSSRKDKCTKVESDSHNDKAVSGKGSVVETDSKKVEDAIGHTAHAKDGKVETVEKASAKSRSGIGPWVPVENDSVKGQSAFGPWVAVENDSAMGHSGIGPWVPVENDSVKGQSAFGPWVSVENDSVKGQSAFGPWVPAENEPVHYEAEKKILGREEIIGKCMTALALLGHANRQICLTRRQFLKPELKNPFNQLCHHFVPVTGYLFGDEIRLTAKEGQEKLGIGKNWFSNRGKNRSKQRVTSESDGMEMGDWFGEREGEWAEGGVTSKRGGRGGAWGSDRGFGRGGRGGAWGSDRGGRGAARGQTSHRGRANNRGRGRGLNNPKGKSFFHSSS